MKTKFSTIKVVILLFSLIQVVQAQTQHIVKVAPGFATVIVCPAPPELVTVGNMDDFSVQSAGNYVLIKPLVSQGTTNMFIKTGENSYNLILQISDSPDVEINLAGDKPGITRIPAEKSGKNLTGTNGNQDRKNDWQNDLLPHHREAQATLPPEVQSILESRFKPDNRYAFSVANSNVIFAVDHMKQVRKRLYVVGTLINNSSIPYDIGFVQFTLTDYARSYIFWRKRLREMEIEPEREFYQSPIPPKTSGRMLFIFEKYGYPQNSMLRIKCTEESGRRDLVLEIPGSKIE